MYTALDYFVDKTKNPRCNELSNAITERSYFIRCRLTAKQINDRIKVHDGNHVIYIEINDYAFKYNPITSKITRIDNFEDLTLHNLFSECRSPEDIIKKCYEYSLKEKS